MLCWLYNLKMGPLPSNHCFFSYLYWPLHLMLKYGGCAFLDELFHLINLYWGVTSLLLSLPTTVTNLLVSFLWEYASNLSSSWSVNYFPGHCLLTCLLFCLMELYVIFDFRDVKPVSLVWMCLLSACLGSPRTLQLIFPGAGLYSDNLAL